MQNSVFLVNAFQFVIFTSVFIISNYINWLILKRDSKNLLNRLFTTGIFIISIGSLISALGLIPSVLEQQNWQSMLQLSFVVYLNCLIIGLSILLASYNVLIHGQAGIGIKFLLMMIVPISSSLLISVLYYDDFEAGSELGDIVMSGYANLLLLIVGLLLVLTFSFYYNVYRITKLRQARQFTLGLLVALIAAVTSVVSNIIEARILDSISMVFIILAFIVIYTGFKPQEDINK